MLNLSLCTKSLPAGGSRKVYPADRKLIVGICQPLLDISAHVEDDFIKRYGVDIGAATLASERQMPMFEEMRSFPNVEYTPGGATLNSIRIAQWILGSGATDISTGFIGAIGDDTNGDYIENMCASEGVHTCLMRVPNTPSGTVAVCVKNGERGLVASINAANEYGVEHLKKNDALLRSAGIVYSSGFFLNCAGGNVSIFAAKRTKQVGGIFCTNLAACYIPKAYPIQLLTLIKFSDYVFGNHHEAEAYAESVGLDDTSLKKVAKYIAQLPREKSGYRTVVLTQGSNSTILARSDGLYMEVPIIRVPTKSIVDFNAAGDSFVGGFLAALSVGEGPFVCVKTGLLAASYIIQQSGCTFKGDFWEETSKWVHE